MKKVVAIVSGGLDSTTMVYQLLANNMQPVMLSFNYGQRHKKELDYAVATAHHLNLDFRVVDLSAVTPLLAGSNSSLVDSSVEVPDGHYAEDTMKQTVVPNRNMIMLSIAAGVAVAIGADAIATGVHSGDHFIYPDCRPGFIGMAEAAIKQGNEGFIADDFAILTPFMLSTKADIAENAIVLGVPFHKTWSCYKGGLYHCGRCGTCVERLEAIDEAAKRQGKTPLDFDYTYYEDSTFWKTVTMNAGS